MRRYPILWHEGTLSHRFSVCVEVGKVILTLPGLDVRCYGLHSACRGGLLHTDPQERAETPSLHSAGLRSCKMQSKIENANKRKIVK